MATPNHKPTITGTTTGDINEDAPGYASGQLTIVDPDDNESFATEVNGAGATYGMWSVNPSGLWSYQLDNSLAVVQSLPAGATLTDSFKVFSLDGSASKTVTITIVGTNDVPTITGTASGTTAEDATTTITGTLTVTDADTGQSAVRNVGPSASDLQYGTWSVDPTGTWKYKIDNSNTAVQGLVTGETLTDHFTVYSKDGSASQVVTITINGVDDKATISGAYTAVAAEDTLDPVEGQLIIADKDAGQAQAVVTGGTATYGTWSVDATGHWTYQLDNTNTAVQALAAGQTLIDKFVVTSLDGSAAKTVGITITGTNDTPTFSGQASGTISEDSTAAITGTLVVSDADAGQSGTVATAPTASTQGYGTWSVDTNGHWTYLVDNTNATVQALPAGQVLQDSFTVVGKDGTGSQVVNITITGTNDPATMSGPVTGSVTEGSNMPAIGTLTVSDTDTGENHTIQLSNQVSTYGTWSVDADGHWSYLVNNSNPTVQALHSGQTLQDQFTVTSVDGTASQTVTITINGAGDAGETFTGTTTGTLTEDTTATISGTVALTDPAHDSIQNVGPTATTYGTWSIDPSGTWKYKLDTTNAEIQGLINGETKTDTFTIHTKGDESQPITITITGVDDKANVVGPVTGFTVSEDDSLTTSGTLTITDKDAGQSHSQIADNVPTKYGTWSVDADGHWNYVLDNSNPAVQALAAGATLLDTFKVFSLDGSAAKQIGVTITGTNDMPTITGQSSGSVAEATGSTVTGTLLVNDVDTNQNHTQAASGASANAYGTWSVDINGHWTYHLDDSKSAIHDLAVGQTLNDSFTVTSSDGSAAQTVNITINGSNQAPTAPVDTDGSDNNVASHAPANTPANITVHSTDSEGETVHYSLTDDAGGKFAIDPNTGVVTTTGPLATGSYSITAVATDGHSNSPSQTFSINVAPTILVVDQSATPDSHTFNTIQAAVDAAGPVAGDVTIQVHTGAYQEQVQVNGHILDGLTIEAAPGAVVTVNPPSTTWESTAVSPTSGRDYDGLITVKDADNVTLRGITVDGQSLGDSAHLVGTNNPTLAGIVYVNTTGGVIDGMDVSGIRESDAGFGNQRNVGIAVLNANPGSTNTPNATDAANLNTIEIKDTTVDNFQKTGIQVSFANADIHGNTVTGIGSTSLTAQNGIQVSGSTGQVHGNEVSGIGYGGADWSASDILTFENNGLSIDSNHVIASPADSTIGIGAEDSVGTTITNNTVDGAQYPIDLEDYPSNAGWPDALGGGTYDLHTNTIINTGGEGAYFQADANSTESFDVTGTDQADTIITGAAADMVHGGAGDDMLDGGAGADQMSGGAGNDTYAVDNAGDIVIENSGEGSSDTVQSQIDYKLGANVENLVLLEGKDSQTINFTSYATGPIANGENGWKADGAALDQGVQTSSDPAHGNVFHISNDPSNDGFGGPYTPELSIKAGELSVGADTDRMVYNLNFKPVSDTADGSRVEIDFANAAGTDRNSFMALEFTQTEGLRLVTNTALVGGDFANDDTNYETGNIQLASGIDPSVWHNIQVVVTTPDGPNNDVVQIYLDGNLVGTTNTFENYFDAVNGGTHEDNAADYLMDRLIFRVAEKGDTVTADGEGDHRQGFLIDDITQAAGVGISGTGNELDNHITGNSLGNVLSGLGGNDVLVGNGGDDALIGGAGNDALDGGDGHDTAVFNGNFADYSISIVGGSIVVQDGHGTEGTDTLTSVEGLKFADTTVLIVDKAGNFGEYTTIQSAVDAAAGVSGHVTVLVMDGDYPENVVIGRSDIALVSLNGADHTTIDGVQAGPEEGAIQLNNGADNVTLGSSGHGFTINGLNGNGSSERSGIYLAGTHDNVTIQGNTIIARGDEALLSEYGQAITNSMVDNNVFGGQTFEGTNPSGLGSSTQFDAGNNVPRQLVVFGSGPGSDNVTFTNNTVGGKTGAESSDHPGQAQGNTLVTIDAAHSTIEGNTFTGDADGVGYALRARGDGTKVSDNHLDQTGGGTNGILVANSTVSGTQIDEYFHDNTFTGGAGNAVITDMTPGSDKLDGGSGNDLLSGSGGDDIINGNDGDDILNGGTGADAMAGGAGNDTYSVDNIGDNVTEAPSNGTDTVYSSIDYTLTANVENLMLVDGPTASQNITFEGYTLGKLSDGENGWKVADPTINQSIVDTGDPEHGKAFLIANNPTSGGFGGPYTPELAVKVGEPGIPGATNSTMTYSLDFKAAGSAGDGSRVEIDFGNAQGTDRENFMVIENTPTGIRIATNEPTTAGDWTVNDFSYDTGNSEIANGLDASQWHNIQLVLQANPAGNNDVIQIYVDGILAGTTTTFENYHDFADPATGDAGHDSNAADNLIDRLMFRVSDPGNDPSSPTHQGFLIDNIQTSTGAIHATGNDLDNVITGNSADNIIEGKGGNDTIDGGAGSDTAVFAGAIGDYAFSSNGSTLTVHDNTSGRDGTDTIVNVENLQFDGSHVLVVGAGGYAHIQDAINAASAGDTIVIAQGTYAENLNIDKSVHIIGAGTVVLQGHLMSDNGIAGTSGNTAAEFFYNSLGGYNLSSGTGITVNADNVTLENLTVRSYSHGIDLGNNDGLTLTNVNVDETQLGIHKDGDKSVTDFSMTGGTISNSYIGMDIVSQAAAAPSTGAVGSFNGVNIASTHFDNLTVKGIYAEQLSNATIDGVVMTDVGQLGRGQSFGGKGPTGAGIDVNLKYDDYSNITIKNFDMTNVGLSNGGGTLPPDTVGGAITIKARSDGSDYGAHPATLDNVHVEDGSIDGTSTGIRIGEPGKGNAGPTDVLVNGVDISNAVLAEYDNQSQATLDVTLSSTDHVVDASAAATGGIHFHGTDDADIITGGGGNDTIDGNGGNDTIIYKTGGGTDTVDGGANTDTLQVDHGDTTPTTFTVAGNTDPSVTIGVSTGGNITTTNVENLVFHLGSGGDTVNIGSLDGATIATSLISVTGENGADIVDAHLIGADNAVGVHFEAGAGDDTFIGGAGDDTFIGGADHDVAVYDGTLSDLTFAFSDAGANQTLTVTSAAGGSDTLSGVEQLTVGAGPNETHVLIVGAGGYATIQAAIDAASDGDTILIGKGTFSGNINVDKSVSIMGSGDDTVIEGSFLTQNGITGSVANWIQTATAYSTAAGNGFTIGADDVSISNLKITGFANGLGLGSSDGLSLSGLTIDNNLYGIYKENGAASVTNFSLTGGTISDALEGIATNADATNHLGSFDGVTITGTTFHDLTWKGIYAEQLSHAVIAGIVMNDVGEFGRVQTFGGTPGTTGIGIDINLKYGSFDGIEIKGFDFDNVGSSSGDPTGAAINVKARDDGGYGSAPASATDINIHDGTIDGTSTGIRVGEPGVNDGGPSVAVSSVTINGQTYDYDNQAHSVLDVQLTSGDDVVTGSPNSVGEIDIHGGAGNDAIAGGGGDDKLEGGAGNDSLDGGGGHDTAVFSGNMADYTITWDGTTAIVKDNKADDGDDGTDTIVGVGKLHFADHDAILVGQEASAEFSTVQSGVNAAQNGDAVLLGKGVFTENVNVMDKSISIEGFGRGTTDNTEVDGTITFSGTVNGAAKVGDLIVNATGHQYGVYISAGSTDYAGSFTLDNVLVENSQTNGFAYILAGNEATPTLSGTLGNIVLTDSQFTGNAMVNSGPGGRGDIIIFGYNQNLTMSDVEVDDAGPGAQKAIQIRGIQNGSTVYEGGTFNLSDIKITGNYPKDLIALVNYAGFTAFNASDFDLNAAAPWGLIHLDGVGGTVDLSHLDGTNAADGGIIGAIEDRTSDDTIFGTAGHDVFTDNLGADTFDGRGGDDTFVVASPSVHPANESINGGDGIDTILFVDTTDGDTLTLHHVSNVENVTIGDINGLITGTHALNVDGSGLTSGVTLTGNDGDNHLTGGAGDDTLYGNGGNDTLDGGGGINHLYGGKGDDVYFVHNSDDVITENAGEGHDTVHSDAASYTLPANVEDLFLDGSGNIDGTGNASANHIVGNDGDNVLSAMGGVDIIEGGGGGDHIDGGTGADTLNGGAGDDVLTGGTGADTFRFDSFMDGHDTITDFDSGNDNLSFKASLDVDHNGIIDDLYNAVASIDNVGSNAVLTFNDGGTITFEGVNIAAEYNHGRDITALVSDPSQVQTHA